MNKAAEIGYNAAPGTKSGTEKWVQNPLTIFPVPFPFLVLLQCEQYSIIYSNPFFPFLFPFPVPVPVPVPFPVPCSVNEPSNCTFPY